MGKEERRAEPRAATRAFLVRVNGSCRDYIYGYAKDISRSGIRLKTFTTCLPNPLQPGERVELEFKMPDSGSDIRCTAELVWNQSPSGQSFINVLQGFRFTELDDTALAEIGRLVKGRR